MTDAAPRTPGVTSSDQQRFARAVTEKLRESRRRQKLTQADVASRTHGLVSKAALANYETGHRSLRIDVLWVIARALGEDLGQLLSQVESEVAGSIGDETQTVSVRIGYLNASNDPRVEPVRRWFELRKIGMAESENDVVNLDADALRALSELMQMSISDLRRILTQHGDRYPQDEDHAAGD